MRKIAILLLSISTAIMLCTIPAQAVTLTFEDLKPACDSQTQVNPTIYGNWIPNGYGGLRWSNFCAVDEPLCCAHYKMTTFGGLNGLVSGDILAFNGSGSSASIMEATDPIALHSAYLTAEWYDGLSVRADGYLRGVLQCGKTVTLSAYHPTLVIYEFNNVDKVTWTSWGGTPVADWISFGGGTQFAMDNMSFDFVPEPSSILALLCGVGGMVGIARRKKA